VSDALLREETHRISADVLVQLHLAQQAQMLEVQQAVFAQDILVGKMLVDLHVVVAQRIWRTTYKIVAACRLSRTSGQRRRLLAEERAYHQPRRVVPPVVRWQLRVQRPHERVMVQACVHISRTSTRPLLLPLRPEPLEHNHLRWTQRSGTLPVRVAPSARVKREIRALHRLDPCNALALRSTLQSTHTGWQNHLHAPQDLPGQLPALLECHGAHRPCLHLRVVLHRFNVHRRRTVAGVVHLALL